MRQATYEDRCSLAALWASCFDDTPQYIQYFFDHRFVPENTCLLEQDGKIVAMLYAMPYRVDIRGKQENTVFLVGVATHPHYRRQGLSKRLIQESLLHLQKRGYRFSHLYPFLHDFYRNLGYETVTSRLVLSYRVGELRRRPVPIGFSGQDISLSNADLLLPLYRQFMEPYTGCILRKDMTALLREHLLDGYGLLVYKENKPLGYALYYTGETGRKAEEFVYLTEDTKEAMLYLLAEDTPEDLLHIGYPYYTSVHGDPAIIKIERQEYGMGRIIWLDGLSVPTRYRGKKTFLLEVKDPYLPHNQGIYQVAVQDGNVIFQKTEAPLEDLQMSCSIRELVAVIQGQQSLRNTNHYTALPPLSLWRGQLLDFFPVANCYQFEQF